jgi:arylsulfatase A-like enzyme/Tfp pilus assembly protein PilF
LARPFRYTFILALVALSTCLAAVGGWRYARASAPVSGPIILISIDSLRADRLPPYGYTRGRTPAIESLAADGIVFEHAYSHVPQTLPAHAALLTGRIPIETGVREGANAVIPASERLVAEMLRDRDFATGAVVSSFLLRAQTGISQGFEFFDADMPESEGRQALHRDGTASVRVAERWLASVGTTRAFLFLHLDEPRGTADVAERFSDLEPYDARIAQADEAVGRLIRYLKTHQLYDQSTVLLVSDHGQGLGQHGEQGHGLFVYDETVRVPLIIKPAAGQGAGRRVEVPVQHVDLVPTVLDLAKAPVPGNLHGRSLTPLFDDGGTLSPVPIYIESVFGSTHFAWSELTSVVEEGYRYIRTPREELYELARDPGERENLVASKPDVAARLRRTLSALSPRVATGVSREKPTPEDRAHYEALGYVGDPSPHFMGPREPVDPKDRWEIAEQFRRAVDRSVAHDWNAAIETLREVVRQEPSMIDAWLRLGAIAARSERHDVAADAYKRVILHEPANLDARLSAALSLLRLKRHDEARQLAQRTAADSMDQPDIRSRAHEVLARIALARRNFDVARSEAALAEDADASRPVIAYVDGRIAFDERRYPEALERFETALAAVEKISGGALADLRVFTAEAMLRLERFSEAEDLFRAQLVDAPLSARARAGLAAAHAAAGREHETTRAGH